MHSELLQEAEDYLRVEPAVSFELLHTIEDVDAMPVESQIRWHLINMRAALPINNLQQLKTSIEYVFYHYEQTYFKKNVTTILSALGIWLRKNNYLESARLSLECAYQNARNDRQRLTLKNSLALLSRQMNDFDSARKQYKQALPMAKAPQRKNIYAMIKMNLGLMALEEHKLIEAEALFREALDVNQSINKREGQISSGLFLLFTFTLQEHVTNYQRLHPRISKLVTDFPNRSRQAMLTWIEAHFDWIRGRTITDTKRQILNTEYAFITDNKEKTLIKLFLTKPLQIDIAETLDLSHKHVFNRPWFELVIACEW